MAAQLSTFFARAKVNLTLSVLGRRNDGFHQIRSLMVPLSLADKLVFEVPSESGGLEFDCRISPALAAHVPKAGQHLLPAQENLAFQALELLAERFVKEFSGGLSLRLHKTIPWEAGLGGGSSDAAGVLVGLNQLLRLGLGLSDLRKIAALLGSDVAPLVSQELVLAGGRGELAYGFSEFSSPSASLSNFCCLLERSAGVLLKPPAAQSSKRAYQLLAAPKLSQADLALSSAMLEKSFLGEIESLLKPGIECRNNFPSRAKDYREEQRSLLRAFRNDFDVVISERIAALALAKEHLLRAGACSTLLCGSGAACLGLTDSWQEAARIEQQLRLELPDDWFIKGVCFSPRRYEGSEKRLVA